MSVKETVLAVLQEHAGTALEIEQVVTGVAERMRPDIETALKELVTDKRVKPVNTSPINRKMYIVQPIKRRF